MKYRIGDHFLELSDSIDYSPGDFKKRFRTEFGFTDKDSFDLISVDSNLDNNVQMFKYQHYYGGLEVENAVLTEDIVDCYRTILHGFVSNEIDLVLSEEIDSIYLKSIITLRYPFHNILSYEKLIMHDIENNCIFRPTFKILLSRLTRPDKNSFDLAVYMDVRSGQIVREVSANVYGSPGYATYYWGSPVILEDSQFGNNYVLKDNIRKITTVYADCQDLSQCPTYDANDWRNVTTSWKHFMRNPTQTWIDVQGVNFSNDLYPNGYAVHYNAGITYDFFKTHFNKSGPGNGKNTSTHITTNTNPFTITSVYIGGLPESTIRDLAFEADHCELSFVAHEWTHLVIHGHNGPGYTIFESKAVNEGFCDIFGSLVTGHYTFAEYQPFRRSLSNPPSTGGIDHYSNINIAPNEHMASGIISKTYFLLRSGGTHYGIQVEAIGEAKVRKLYWDMMIHKLRGDVDFKRTKEAAIISAIELFGLCSWELKQVTNAWASVGLGSIYNDLYWVNGQVTFCKDDSRKLSLDACFGHGDPNGQSYEWYFPEEWLVRITGEYNQYFTVLSYNSQNTQTERFRVMVKSPTGVWLTVWVTLKNCTPDSPDDTCKRTVIRSTSNASVYNGMSAEYNQKKLKFQPNPAKDFLTISVLDKDDDEDIIFGYFSLISLEGEVILKKICNSKNIVNIDIQNISSGIYIVEFFDEITKKRFYGKIIKI